MLEIGTDEFTLVLQIPADVKRSDINPCEWRDIAEGLVANFAENADFESIYGEMTRIKQLPAGYNVGYCFGLHNFNFAIAYNDMQMNMGVIVKFSAQALDYYLEKSGEKVYEFLQKVQDPKWYSMRLSRIDLTADYIDEDINVTNIYNNYIDNKIAIFHETINNNTGELSHRRVNLKCSGFVKEMEIPTMYLGSSQSNSELRIYDKKAEQIQRSGSKLAKAKACDNWIRFEGVFRHEFAHQIGDALLQIDDDKSFYNFIANTLLQKFAFKNIKSGVIIDDTYYTDLLRSCVGSKDFILKSPESRNYDLSKNFMHIFKGSGTIATLHKIKSIWGDNAIEVFFDYMREYMKDFYKPNDDCIYWLRRNENDYKSNYKDFNTFLNENINSNL